jgi:hypothetical protein
VPPCPAGSYCSSGAPLPCPAGFYCPALSWDPTPCPAGNFSAGGAASCAACPGGTYSTQLGATSAAACQVCNVGYFCPPGTGALFGVPCGVGNYCPAGSAAPLPCPAFGMVEATRGPANGPAFDVDTAACYNQCVAPPFCRGAPFLRRGPRVDAQPLSWPRPPIRAPSHRNTFNKTCTTPSQTQLLLRRQWANVRVHVSVPPIL